MITPFFAAMCKEWKQWNSKVTSYNLSWLSLGLNISSRKLPHMAFLDNLEQVKRLLLLFLENYSIWWDFYLLIRKRSIKFELFEKLFVAYSLRTMRVSWAQECYGLQTYWLSLRLKDYLLSFIKLRNSNWKFLVNWPILSKKIKK